MKKNHLETVQAIIKCCPYNRLAAMSKLLYRAISQNSFKTEEMSEQIALLEQLDHALLEQMLRQLQVDSSKLMPSSSGACEAEVLMTSVQTLLNYPDVKPPIHLLQIGEKDHGARFVSEIVQRREGIKNYLEKIKQPLRELQKKAAGVFYVKCYFPLDKEWKEGIPDHVEQIRKSLNKLAATNTLGELVTMYQEVEKILANIQPLESRHGRTTDFYNTPLKPLQSITFLSATELEKSLAVQVLPLKGSLLDLPAMPVQPSVVATPIPFLQPEPVAIVETKESAPVATPGLLDPSPPYVKASAYRSTLFAELSTAIQTVTTTNPEDTLVLPDVPHDPLPRPTQQKEHQQGESQAKKLVLA